MTIQANTTPNPKRKTLGLLSRVIVAVAALIPILTFFFPLWHYYFEAPQYPEGLRMSIWSYRLGGQVDLINGLNHYVGFMFLDPADFLEFRVLPVMIVLVILVGLWAAISGSRRVLTGWIIGYVLFGVGAFIDFFRWLYTFGHTIDPMAIIDVPGYTPPMIGGSVFMNFYIISYPGVSFYLLIGSILIAASVLLSNWLRRPKLLNLGPQEMLVKQEAVEALLQEDKETATQKSEVVT